MEVVTEFIAPGVAITLMMVGGWLSIVELDWIRDSAPWQLAYGASVILTLVALARGYQRKALQRRKHEECERYMRQRMRRMIRREGGSS